ncbi:MAG TPA: hypothetical protein VGK10_11485 [Prolixibacteraceae bacterium]|jgi:hypothetical protein
MKNLTTALFFLLFTFTQLQAQTIEDWVAAKKPLLFEKLYLHVDRELYTPGDRISLKAYQVNGITHQLNTNFRNIFVQLLSEEGTVVKDLMLLSIGGQANGEFQTEGLANGMYTIRATTKYLENFGEEACFHQKIWIINSLNPVNLAQKDQATQPAMDVSFLPEGGNLVLNAVNMVAFKAIDEKGKGISVKGQIMDESGDTITSFASSYRGMGKLMLMPEEGVNYYASIDGHPELKILLPKANGKALCLNYKTQEESLMFEISANMNVEKFPEFYFVAAHKGLVLFHQKITMVDYTQAIKVSKSMFPKGISKITLLDLALNPIAERLIFVDDGKDDLLSLHVSQKEFKPREEVKLETEALLQPGDTLKSALSVTVVNKSYLSTGENSQNIKSYLLLDSDLKGAIESPASYFVNDQLHTSAEKLDLLMLVNGWRSYVWDDVEQKPTPVAADWNNAGINISGYVKKILWKAPVVDAEVSMDYVFRNFKIGKTTTDNNGRFLFKNTYLIDTLDVMINARTKHGTRNAEIILDSLPKRDLQISPLLLNNNCFNIDLNPDFKRYNSFRQQKELEFNPEKGTILLDGVDIVRNKTSSFTRSFGEYPWANKTLIVTPKDYSFTYLIDYVEYNVPSLVRSGDYMTLSNKPVAFMLDGLDTDLQEILTVRMPEIELIDVVNPGFRLPGELGVVDSRGLISIYRKDIHKIDIHYLEVKGRIIPELKGFHRAVLFYSPKYTMENFNSPEPDFRPTLYWNPDVSFVDGKASLGFFTSDVLADYVVYMEGITKEGKICYGTTNFTVDK